MRSTDTYHAYLNQEMCFAFWLQNLKEWGFWGNLGVKYNQHDVTEMRCEVIFEIEMYKISSVNWLVVVKKMMEDLGRCHGQKFRLYIYEWCWHSHTDCWNSKHQICVLVPWLRRLVALLSPRSLGIDLTAVHLWFVVDKVPLLSVSLVLLRFCLLIVFPPMLHDLI